MRCFFAYCSDRYGIVKPAVVVFWCLFGFCFVWLAVSCLCILFCLCLFWLQLSHCLTSSLDFSCSSWDPGNLVHDRPKTRTQKDKIKFVISMKRDPASATQRLSSTGDKVHGLCRHVRHQCPLRASGYVYIAALWEKCCPPEPREKGLVWHGVTLCLEGSRSKMTLQIHLDILSGNWGWTTILKPRLLSLAVRLYKIYQCILPFWLAALLSLPQCSFLWPLGRLQSQFQEVQDVLCHLVSPNLQDLPPKTMCWD